MKIAITGGSGVVGTAVIERALARGDGLLSIDRTAPSEQRKGVDYAIADIVDYERLCALLVGQDAVIHLAAIPWPFRDPDHVVHNNNVVGSYNVMRAAIECGITRICQASSVNAIGLSYSREAQFDYFPLDEKHPNHGEDAYSLSKWVCEQQADALVRRYADVAIASLRFHWVTERDIAAQSYHKQGAAAAKHLWSYTSGDAAASACLLAVDGRFRGHEVFYITAPNNVADVPTSELAARHFPGVPITGDLSGNRSFFDSSKAERLLGWRHDAS